MPTHATGANPAPEPPTTLNEALARLQATLPPIAKGKTARVTMKGGGEYTYKYADLADIQPLVLPMLAPLGLTWVTLPTLTDGGMVLQYALTHASEKVEGAYPLPDPRARTPQEIGSAITYARRYVLCCVLGIVPDEDEDGVAAVSAQREADARREEERHDMEVLNADRAVLLGRLRVATEALGRSRVDVADEFTRTYGEAVGTTRNLHGLGQFVDALVAEAAKPKPQPDSPQTQPADLAAAEAAAAAGLGAVADDESGVRS